MSSQVDGNVRPPQGKRTYRVTQPPYRGMRSSTLVEADFFTIEGGMLHFKRLDRDDFEQRYAFTFQVFKNWDSVEFIE